MESIFNNEGDTVGYIEQGESGGWFAYIYESGNLDDEATETCWRTKKQAEKHICKNGVVIQY